VVFSTRNAAVFKASRVEMQLKDVKAMTLKKELAAVPVLEVRFNYPLVIDFTNLT